MASTQKRCRRLLRPANLVDEAVFLPLGVLNASAARNRTYIYMLHPNKNNFHQLEQLL